MFGKPKHLKKLELQLLTSRVLFDLYGKLPPEKQAMAMENDPRELAEAVHRAAAAGDAETVRAMLDTAAQKVPAGVTPAQWAQIMSSGYGALA